MLVISDIPPATRAKAHLLASACDRDWRTCMRWLLRMPVRRMCAEAIERAAESLHVVRGAV